MSNVRRRISTGTQPQSSSQCKCIWRLRKRVDDSPFTVSTLCLRSIALLQVNTAWNATSIAHWWPPCVCRTQEPFGLPVPPAGGRRTKWYAPKAANSEQIASRERSAQAHLAHEHKRIGRRLMEGSWKPENTASCVLAGVRSQERPECATAADA